MSAPVLSRPPIRPTAALSSLRLVAEVYAERGEVEPTSVYVRQVAELRFADGQSCRVYGLTVPEVQLQPGAARGNRQAILDAATRDLEPLSQQLAALPLGLEREELRLIEPDVLARGHWELELLED